MSDVTEAVEAVQEIAAEVSPAPVKFERMTSAQDVVARLNWGEPALTIVDVRDRDSFNNERILGAIHIPVDELMPRLRQTLEEERDIYLYGDSDAEAAQVATQLKDGGFERVALIEGGLSAWKAAGGTTEGRV